MKMHTRRVLRYATLATLTACAVIGGGLAEPASADSAPLESRRYAIALQEIRALDETGRFNSFVSDDIYAGFQTSFPGGQTHVQTGSYDGFDAGERRVAANDRSCLPPLLPLVNKGSAALLSSFEGDTWGCSVSGSNAPFDVRARLFESDFDFENPFCIDCEFAPRPISLEPEMERIDEDDDPVGETRISFSQQGLAADLAEPGASRDDTVDHRGSGAHYQVTYRVTRLR